MKKLISGIRHFQSHYIPSHQALMAELSREQHPRVLFIACSDSRVDPALLTHADIGDLFVIRNAGNIIPPYEATNGGEGATIEYAIHALDIQQIIVCGHSNCGAMKGLLKLNQLQDSMPLVYDWLRHTEATRRLVKDNYSHLDKDEMLEVMVAENVLTQIENLRTYPVIHSKLHKGKLSIHAWIYKIETGEVRSYDAKTHAFVPPYSTIDPEAEGEGFTGETLGPLAAQHSQEDNSALPKAPLPAHMPGANRLSRQQAERIFGGSIA